MKKTLSLLLAAVLLLSLCGCGKSVTAFPVHIEGSIFGGQSGDSLAAELRFDPKWMTSADNRKYSPELAAFSALLCADTYYREKDLAKGTQNRVLFDGSTTEYGYTAFLETVGFTDVQRIESFRVKEYDSDSNDSVTMTLGYRNVDGKYDAFVVALRGCFSAQEWLSIFDPGSDSDGYTSYTGEHPEWTDRRQFKGLNIAANRADEFLKEFIAAHDDPDRKNCVLLTGHSRGGALANILGAELEQAGDAKTFTYTFNAPPVTEDPDAGKCKTVFNLFDSRDFYTDPLPFGAEHFLRYGHDLTVQLSDSDKAMNALSALVGRDDYNAASDDVLKNYRTQFAARFSTRKSLYETQTVTETFSTQAEAETRLSECQTLIGAEAGLGLESLCTMGSIEKAADGTFTLCMEYCPAALITAYSKVLSYGSAANDAVQALFRADESGCAIASLLNDHLAELSAGHRLANGYILSGYVK